MVVTHLNLTPRVHAWRLAGLSCLLCSGTASALPDSPDSVLPATRHISGSLNGEAVTPLPLTTALRSGAKLFFSADAEEKEQQNRTANAFSGTAEFQQTTSELAAPKFPQRFAALKDFAAERATSAELRFQFDPTQLPCAWRKILNKVHPAPIAWTYLELGGDLLFGGSAARSQALKELIQALNLPKGSSTFWPAVLPAAPEDQESNLLCSGIPESVDIFLSGLDYLGVKYLIVFGEQGLRGTSYEKFRLSPFAEQILNGRLLLPLPSFDLLLSDGRWMEAVTKFLRSVLSTFYKA